MYTTMKQITFFSFALLMMMGSWTCNAQAGKKSVDNSHSICKSSSLLFSFYQAMRHLPVGGRKCQKSG